MTYTKKIKNIGIVIEDKYAQLIRKRLKKEIISTENLHNFVGKEIYLCGNFVYGSIILNEPLKLDFSLLANHSKRHLISKDDILKLWPDCNIFYSYSFRINKMFKSGIKYNKNINHGIIEDIEFLNKQEDKKIEMKKEENETIEKVEYYKSYEDKLDELKKLEFSENYKNIAESFLALYELYLNKLLSKVYDGDGIVLKPAPDITENYIRVRIRNPKTIVEGSFRTIIISESQGIKAVVGKLKSDPQGPKHIQSVLFDKEKWTPAEAMKWVEGHREDLKSLLAEDFKEKSIENYIGTDYVDEDKDKGKQKEKWVWCKKCKKSFDYYKQLLDDKSTVLCPHCGALVIFEEKE